MGTGTLHLETTAADGAMPVAGARVVVTGPDGGTLYDLITDAEGRTRAVSLTAPDRALSLSPGAEGPVYGSYDVTASKPGYITEVIRGTQIYDGVTSTLPLNLIPLPASYRNAGLVRTAETPPPAVQSAQPRDQQGDTAAAAGRVLRDVVIPEYITVHLGPPNASARNVRVRFADYIKNVASSEIYATWPEAALEANIDAEITFALNRIYTEWYRARGYDFDITNSTAYDQAFVENRNIFDNIGGIVDNVFNQYARRQGRRDPYFTQFCNGTTVTCPGLSQWGTVPLAEQGLNPLQILRYYYPKDLELVTTDNIAGVPASYPGSALSQGSQGDGVRTIQQQLNRIRADYPAIPQISSSDGVYGPETANAVKTFQSVFGLTPDGVVGSATWYKISSLYTAVTRLAELDSEGERIGLGAAPPAAVLRTGTRGGDVAELQFILNRISAYYPAVPTVIQDSVFGPTTAKSVQAFQGLFGLTADGVVGPGTWNALYDAYRGIEDTQPAPAPPAPTPPAPGAAYPGYALQSGARGESVRLMQQYLNALSAVNAALPALTADGSFGPATRNAVLAFQRLYGLTQDGVIGSATWARIVAAYQSLGQNASAPYPGYYISSGSVGDYVRLIQRALNTLSAQFSSIPAVTVDGVFGPGTRSAVVAFQRLVGLLPDGVVGEQTWNQLMENR